MKSVDLIFHNGNIQTQDDLFPKVSAVAISDNRILDIGSDQKILSCASKNTNIVDLEQKLVLPGFIDTHFHFYEWALNYDNIDFSGTLSLRYLRTEIFKRVILILTFWMEYPYRRSSIFVSNVRTAAGFLQSLFYLSIIKAQAVCHH